jgi:type VI secretion system protein
MRRAIRRTLCLAALAALGACSILPSWLGGGRSISRISIDAEPGANQNSAIAVDLVMLSDPEAAASIMKLSARDWFQRRQQFTRDYPNGLKIMSWEMAPGQLLRDASVDSLGGMTDAIVFADYRGDGDHRLRLGDNSQVRLLLDNKDVRLAP